MKVISSYLGSAVIHASSDEVTPEKGINQKDIVNFVGTHYRFNSRPALPEGSGDQPILAFQSGKFEKNGEIFTIGQLIMMLNADIISAQNTDIATDIAKDFMETVEAHLGFRYSKASVKITYLSNVVVEFEHIGANPLLLQIEKIIESAVKRPERSFSSKRFAFGEGDVQPQIGVSLQDLGKADFIIERRAGSPYSANRFFCAAPLSTSEHFEVLTKIDQALAT